VTPLALARSISEGDRSRDTDAIRREQKGRLTTVQPGTRQVERGPAVTEARQPDE
jgi:hypothetical protein